MPEYPDIVTYLDCLAPRVLQEPLQELIFKDPFVLRSVSPSPKDCQGKRVVGLRRMGKRIVLALEAELFVVIHLMIAGRLRWRESSPKWVPSSLMRFRFPKGDLFLTEAGTKRRAKIFVVQGEDSLAEHDPGGLEIFETNLAEFAKVLTLRNHTLKRALTDPHLFSGIGNAYSDEILLRSRLSPVKLTQKLAPEEIERLFEVTRATLESWAARLRAQTGEKFPEHVTAFHPEMAVHGKFGQPCPVCGGNVQRIRYADNETNYCPNCQTEGRLLADRSLSRLLKKDWPRSLDELDEHLAKRRA